MAAKEKRAVTQPRKLSREVAAQLRKLEELNDRAGVLLLWRAIHETEGRRA